MSVPPPPPPVVPLEDVARARAADLEARARIEATIDRASALPEGQCHQGVNGEWSTVESLRHLVLVIDLWLSKIILGASDPFHPMALPPTFMPPKLPGSSIDPDARPSFAEACAVLRDRMAILERYVGGVTDDELARPVEAHAKTVGGALSVLFQELTAHDHFVNRDLDLLAAAD